MTDNQQDNKGRSRGKPFGSGNRGRPGRRKGARNDKTVLTELAMQRHSVRFGDEVRILNTVELLLVKLQQHAQAGNVPAAKLLDRLQEEKQVQASNLGVALFPETLTEEEWLRRTEIENKYKKPPPEV